MTQEELNKAIFEIVIPIEKPKSTGNSHKRKQWENRRYWWQCTVGKTCKLGSLKDYDELYRFYDKFNHYIHWVSWISSSGKLGSIHYDNDHHYFKHHSYSNKYSRRVAERMVRKYKGEISNGSNYKKIYDYQWSCW